MVAGSPPATPPRQVAFTFDDVPGVHYGDCTPGNLRRLNSDLVAAIVRNRIPATGLVVDRNNCAGQSLQSLYEMWLDAGIELGNHTASHRDFNRTPLAEYEADTIAGEATLRPLLEKRDKKLRYFRFPMLHTGTDLTKKRAFEKFLDDRKYTNAVVSIDNDDYLYAIAYMKASDVERKRIARDYVAYMDRIFAFYEKLSLDTLGYELPQVLLLHDSRLNADTLDALVAMVRARGYTIVPLEKALGDPAYRRRDAYVGAKGLSWLHRWALDDGKSAPEQPPVDSYIQS